MAHENLDQRLAELEEKWLNGTITPEEMQEYAAWYNTLDTDTPLEIPATVAESREEHRQQLLDKINRRRDVVTLPARKPRYWWAAAAVLLIAAGAAWYLYHSVAAPETGIAKQNNTARQDVAPGATKATLTLADGSVIQLDSTAGGHLPAQGNTSIVKLAGGKLVYSSTGGAYNKNVLFNTMTTPRGGEYKLVLPDGTGVWLNSASSITYPTAFNSNKREVKITGEVYFEVTKNEKAPFFVVAHDMQVQVLGTSFNVNAYTDEGGISTTLLDGAVRVISGKQVRQLTPGTQALVRSTGDIQLIRNIDTELVIAWKNGFFQFRDADVKTVMQQLARWYDVEVAYEGNIPERKFSGKIYRNVNASEVLEILSYSKVHFRIEGKKIVVMP